VRIDVGQVPGGLDDLLPVESIDGKAATLHNYFPTSPVENDLVLTTPACHSPRLAC